MSHEKELEIKCLFLEEAQDYLGTLEAALLGLANRQVDLEKVNAALRAAHSIKGGAGMMGFGVLSQLAHRLEDSFKVLKTQKHSLEIDAELEGLLLAGVDCLRYTIQRHKEAALKGEAQEDAVELAWLATEAEPLFEQLGDRLGEPVAEDVSSVLPVEDGQDVIPLLFETEVEGCLQRLEAVLADPQLPCLREELEILAQELGGLGEMLQLSAFSQLCESVMQQLAAAPEQVEAIAHLALQAWRRSQALILTGQLHLLPTTLEETEAAGEQAGRGEWLFARTVGEEAQSLIPIPEDEEEMLVTSVSEVQATAPHFEPTVLDPLLEIKPDDLALAPSEEREASVRVPAKSLEQLNELFGELTIERNGLNLQLKRLAHLASTLNQRLRRMEQANLQLQSAYDRAAAKGVGERESGRAGEQRGRGAEENFLTQNSVRAGFAVNSSAVTTELSAKPAPTTLKTQNFPSSQSPVTFDLLELDRYNELYLLGQEVTESVVQLQEVSSDIELSLEETEQTARNLDRTAKQMQTRLNQVRMRPLSDILNRFPVALRELSLQYGKPVELKIYGQGTLVDRSILEVLHDPLMHLLRNAFDHGIEDPQTRRARGKSEQGLIEIRASHRSNRTLITIRDDGGGIPLDKIKARAIAMGLDAELLDSASDRELLSLIFQPGFTTKEAVTNLSGRGVGMDVVCNNLKQIRGDVQVDTQPGMGTTFTITVPYTLSVTRVLIAEINRMLLAFPADTIQEIVTLAPEQISVAAGQEVLNLEGTSVSLVRPSRTLAFNCPRHFHELPTPPAISTPAALIVNQDNQLTGIAINRCWREQEVTVRAVEGILPLPPGFSNCAVLGDGRVIPVVNVPEFLQWSALTHAQAVSLWENGFEEAIAELETLQAMSLQVDNDSTAILPPEKNTILIVDDSINVRRFLALTLEKAGYQVEQARDGQDALEKLQGGLNPRAAICDIEMPHLDGYGFLAQVKADTHFKELPVIMLTSRTSDKHRQLAMSLGAAAYFSKPYNEQALLQTLETQLAHG